MRVRAHARTHVRAHTRTHAHVLMCKNNSNNSSSKKNSYLSSHTPRPPPTTPLPSPLRTAKRVLTSIHKLMTAPIVHPPATKACPPSVTKSNICILAAGSGRPETENRRSDEDQSVPLILFFLSLCKPEFTDEA